MIQCRGWLNWKYCAAHIWCWPTPVVTIVSSSWPRSLDDLPQPLDGVLRQDGVVAVGVAQRLRLAPVLDLPHPVGVRAPARGASAGSSSSSCTRSRRAWPTSPTIGSVGDLVLVDLRRVDVDVDDLAVLGELADLAGDAVVEAHAEGQQQVGLVDGVVGVDGAVHAEHVQAEEVLAREAAQAVQRQGDGDAGLLGELRAGASPAPDGDDAAAGVDDRLACSAGSASRTCSQLARRVARRSGW